MKYYSKRILDVLANNFKIEAFKIAGMPCDDIWLLKTNHNRCKLKRRKI